MRKTDNEIIETLQAAAAKKGVKLTYTHKLFFVKLLTYACKYGQNCPEGIMVLMPIDDLAAYLSISTRMVSQSLKVLRDCDIIIRCRGEKKFPRGISRTIIKKEYYETGEGKEMYNMLFEDEECQYINRLTEQMEQGRITKQAVLENIAFAREIAAGDADILSLIDGVYSKIDSLSVDEWDEMKRLLPFPVSTTAEDDTFEVPDMET